LFAPFYLLLVWGTSASLLAVCVMSLLLLWRHVPNMRKLFAGTESRLGAKPAVSRGPTPKHPANHHPTHAHSHGHGHGHGSKKGHK
jgi:glycerol-3-phosphate acyltransferase PlsY